MKQISLTYCGMHGEGPTVKEAKQDATRKISNVLSGEWYPTTISCRGNYSMIFRTPMGWFYSAPRAFGENTDCTCGSFETKREAEGSARWHLAQNAWTITDGPSVPENIITDTNGVRDFTTWAKWQIRYAELKAEGKSDEECRNMASGF